MEPRRLKILLFNVGYATELDGSMREYLLRFYRYLYTPRYIIEAFRQRIAELLEQTQPDLCCFIEVHRDMQMLPDMQAYAYSNFENKYGVRSVLRHLPFFRNNCNGFLARKPLRCTKRFLRHGTKKLVYEIELADSASLLLAHLSLNAHVRRKQMEDLIELLKDRPRTIVCGDFNTFGGSDEVQMLMDECNLELINPPSEATFPAVHPRKSLDLVLCPKSMKVHDFRVLHDVHVSDHLPVLVDVTV
jgi:endonuclease/exonuclease/phosphatase family metal-dependent hydrolase